MVHTGTNWADRLAREVWCPAQMDLLAAELIDGCRHLIVQLLIKFALLRFIPTTDQAETIKGKVARR